MVAKKKKHKLYRKITHSEYKGIKKIGDKGPQSWLQRVIIEPDQYGYKNNLGYEVVTDEFMKIAPYAHLLPQIGGG
jgi:hypothetical protein